MVLMAILSLLVAAKADDKVTEGKMGNVSLAIDDSMTA